MAKRALITGITGQDGSYLAELLLERGFKVFGLVRGESLGQAAHLGGRFVPLSGDLRDGASLRRAVGLARPHRVYNLAAQTCVRTSYEDPVGTAEVTGAGAVRMLEATRELAPDARIYQASSSEMFGTSPGPQSLSTPFRPRSPYGAAKLQAHWHVATCRACHGTWAVSGIQFNHESPRRGEAFVTRKVTRAVARIHLGLQRELLLGDLSARRDWGHARDAVRAMVLMMEAAEPRDQVVGTGETRSVEDLVEASFACVGLDWRQFVRQDPSLLRPAEPNQLVADPAQVQRSLGWRPRISFEDLVREMVEADLEREARSLGAAAVGR
ncbi:MAG: GDP-mannose 4,6-dehydratase [Planctomycetota bacterium]|nr:GDP-mannose 4,6-dehydratase [Planctomycetota bacterium]